MGFLSVTTLEEKQAWLKFESWNSRVWGCLSIISRNGRLKVDDVLWGDLWSGSNDRFRYNLLVGDGELENIARVLWFFKGFFFTWAKSWVGDPNLHVANGVSCWNACKHQDSGRCNRFGATAVNFLKRGRGARKEEMDSLALDNVEHNASSIIESIRACVSDGNTNR